MTREGDTVPQTDTLKLFFASSFRKMLTIEQFRSEEMQNLYQQYLVAGPASYVKDLFESIRIVNAKNKAVLMIFLFAASYVWLMALTGLALGIKMPVLTWTNEIMPIKQGASVIITLFGGFVYMALLFAGFMLLPGWILGFCGYMSCYVGVNLFISVLAYMWLRKKGVAILGAL